MSRRVQHPEKHLAHSQLEAILHRDVWEPGAGTSSDVNLGAGTRGKLFVSGNKIGVQMSLKDMADLHFMFFRSFQVNVHISLRIDHDRFAP